MRLMPELTTSFPVDRKGVMEKGSCIQSSVPSSACFWDSILKKYLHRNAEKMPKSVCFYIGGGWGL